MRLTCVHIGGFNSKIASRNGHKENVHRNWSSYFSSSPQGMHEIHPAWPSPSISYAFFLGFRMCIGICKLATIYLQFVKSHILLWNISWRSVTWLKIIERQDVRRTKIRSQQTQPHQSTWVVKPQEKKSVLHQASEMSHFLPVQSSNTDGPGDFFFSKLQSLQASLWRNWSSPNRDWCSWMTNFWLLFVSLEIMGKIQQTKWKRLVGRLSAL